MVWNNFATYSKSNVQNFFRSSIFPLPYIVILEIGIRFSITDLVLTKFMIYRFSIFGLSFPWKYWLPSKTHPTKFQSFSKNCCSFYIDQSKGRLVKRQLKMLGMVQKKLYRTTLIVWRKWTVVFILKGQRFEIWSCITLSVAWRPPLSRN